VFVEVSSQLAAASERRDSSARDDLLTRLKLRAKRPQA
jgi:hypothetical protein